MKRSHKLLLALVGLVVLAAIFPPSQPRTASPPEAATAIPPKPEIPLTPAEKKKQQEKWYGTETIVAAQRAVRNSLKDPKSADFRNVHANYTEELGGVVACGEVNSKNSFGGYTGFKSFVSDGQTVMMEGIDNLQDVWAKACR